MKYPDNIQRKYLGDTQVYKKQWVGLTEEDKDEIIRVTMHNDFCDILMLVEAKLKEKNT